MSDVLPSNTLPELILWAYVIDVKYLLKSVAYWMSVIYFVSRGSETS